MRDITYTSCTITWKDGYYSIFPKWEKPGGRTGGGSFAKIWKIGNYFVYSDLNGKPVAVFKDKTQMLIRMQEQYGCEIIEK